MTWFDNASFVSFRSAPVPVAVLATETEDRPAKPIGRDAQITAAVTK